MRKTIHLKIYGLKAEILTALAISVIKPALKFMRTDISSFYNVAEYMNFYTGYNDDLKIQDIGPLYPADTISIVRIYRDKFNEVCVDVDENARFQFHNVFNLDNEFYRSLYRTTHIVAKKLSELTKKDSCILTKESRICFSMSTTNTGLGFSSDFSLIYPKVVNQAIIFEPGDIQRYEKAIENIEKGISKDGKFTWLPHIASSKYDDLFEKPYDDPFKICEREIILNDEFNRIKNFVEGCEAEIKNHVERVKEIVKRAERHD